MSGHDLILFEVPGVGRVAAVLPVVPDEALALHGYVGGGAR